MCCISLSHVCNFSENSTFPDFSFKSISAGCPLFSIDSSSSFEESFFYVWCQVGYSWKVSQRMEWRTGRQYVWSLSGNCISQILPDVFLRCFHMYFSDSGYSWKVSQRMEDRPAIGGSFCLECSYTCRNIYGMLILMEYNGVTHATMYIWNGYTYWWLCEEQ